MSVILKLSGISPFILFRFLITLILISAFAGFIFYQNSVRTKYAINSALNIQKAKKISFDICDTNPVKKCFEEILKKHELTSATESILVMTKLVDFFSRKKTKGNQETILKDLQLSINELLQSVKLKNHLLLKIKPIISFSGKALCNLQKIEKKNTEKVINKLSEQCDKDRQVSFEAYPDNKELQYIFVRRKEILLKLTTDLENAFPKEMLNKCEKKTI